MILLLALLAANLSPAPTPSNINEPWWSGEHYAYTSEARFTAQHFRNAPEAISRVVAVRRFKDGSVLLRLNAGACTANLGGTIEERVFGAEHQQFRPGDFVMTGPLSEHGRLISAIRLVNAPEAHKYHCPFR